MIFPNKANFGQSQLNSRLR